MRACFWLRVIFNFFLAGLPVGVAAGSSLWEPRSGSGDLRFPGKREAIVPENGKTDKSQTSIQFRRSKNL